MNLPEHKMPEPYDTVSADTLEVGDQVIIDGDYVEVRDIRDTDDIDEVVVVGYSHESGDTETYSLYADDMYGLWAL